MRRGIVAALLALSTGSQCLAGQPYENQWGPFNGTVVDASTGAPIPGAVFSVYWMADITYPFHSYERFFDARVEVANEEGRFEIPRRSPPILGMFVDTVSLSCVAPGYRPYMDVGTQNAPIAIRLSPLSDDERRRLASDDARLNFPESMCHDFERQIDERRKQMHLSEMGLCSHAVDSAYLAGKRN